MALTYEDALRIVRDSISTADIPGNPATFDPPPWAIRAVELAWRTGAAHAYHVTRAAAQPAIDAANACAEQHAGAGLPEGG